MWACRYVITRPDGTQLDGYPDGNTYASREQAEAAALAKAQSLIRESGGDKDPLGSG